MTTVVFGGTGFIGQRVVDRLADEETVICVDIQTAESSQKENVRIIEGDVTDRDAVSSIVEQYKPDRILNLAYVLGAKADEDPSLAVRVNCTGMDNVLRAAVDWNVERLVYASSITIYGKAGTYDAEASENVNPPAASSQYPWLFYGATKQLNEYQSRMYADKYGLSVANVRPSIVFGPGRDSGLTQWASQFVSLPARDEPGHLPFASDQPLEMVYREDVADIIATLIRAESLDHHVYNTGGHTITADALAQTVEDVVGGTVTLGTTDQRSQLVPEVSNERATDEFGFELTPLEDCLRDHAARTHEDSP